MFGFRLSVKCAVAVLLAGLMASGVSALEAQSTHRTRRESNANRKARIARTIEDTYTHRWEVGGGGGYLRFRSGENLQKNNQVSFWSTGMYSLNPKLGIVGDVRGSYGNAKVGNTIFNIENPQISQYTFMGGPSYRLWAKEKTAISIFGVGGAALGKFDSGAKGLSSADIHVWESGFAPVMSVGANFDYNLYPNFAIRVTPTYLGTFFRLSPDDTSAGSHGTIQNNLGVNVGLVYRFGRIK
jgi:opacity protein-like surface antigen